MVKFSFFSKTIRMMACVLVMSVATNVSAKDKQYWGDETEEDLREHLVDSGQKEDKDKKKKDKKGKKTQESNVQKAEDDVELVVSGEGTTKDEATKVALRSAIEQTYGTFVSANTNILNDALVKDEIVTVSSGNVKGYKYIAENNVNGKYHVTLQAVVSIGKLVQYVQSKGGAVELAGANFAMDVKMKRLYKQNEETALQDLMTQLYELAPLMFDYSIEVKEPRADYRKGFACSTLVKIRSNENYTYAKNLIWETLGALSLKSETEVNDYERKGVTPVRIYIKYLGTEQYMPQNEYNEYRKILSKFPHYNRERVNTGEGNFYPAFAVFLRSSKFLWEWTSLMTAIFTSFVIDDGLRKTVYSTDDIFYASSRCDYKGAHGEFSYKQQLDEIYFNNIDRESPSIWCPLPLKDPTEIKIEGNLFFTESELEKVSVIKVIPNPEVKNKINKWIKK